MIRRLFAVDRLSTRRGETPALRKKRRLRDSAPVLRRLRAWITEQRSVIPPKTPLGRALGYLHRQWERLSLFLTDGRIELTNNRVERELRRLVCGRKNWLFTSHDIGGERTAAILTVLGTCIAQRVNPRAYLQLVTKLLIEGSAPSETDELLPDRLVVRYPELRLPAPAQPLDPLLLALVQAAGHSTPPQSPSPAALPCPAAALCCAPA